MAIQKLIRILRAKGSLFSVEEKEIPDIETRLKCLENFGVQAVKVRLPEN